MDSAKWSLFFVCFCFKVTQAAASSWTVNVPSSVKGLLGSCVVIPCAFNYPDPDKRVTKFTGMWMSETNHLIYHPVESKVIKQFQGRTELLGNVSRKSCSLKIDPLQQSDQGPFYFRIEMEGYEQYSYKMNTVSITMISELSPINFSLKVEGQNVSASCSVTHSCPASPPVLTWSHSGAVHVQSQHLQDGQWNATSTLTFQATGTDHNKSLQCTVRYKGGRHNKISKVLSVTHAPVNVKVEYNSDVVEGEVVQLKCSSDAHPPASKYTWYNEAGAQVHQGKVFMLPNVSRYHTGHVYCTAINKVGQGKSSPVELNVLYAPELKTASSCSTEADMVKCVCIAESKPPSMVHFVLSGRVHPSTKVEKHGSVTIGTLQAELGSYEFVLCLANNTQGKANLTLVLPVNILTGKMQSLYIIIAIGAGVILLILSITVGFVIKCRGRSGVATTSDTSTMRAGKDVKLPQYATTKRKEKNVDDDIPGIYENGPVYDNMEDDSHDAIYANM